MLKVELKFSDLISLFDRGVVTATELRTCLGLPSELLSEEQVSGQHSPLSGSGCGGSAAPQNQDV